LIEANALPLSQTANQSLLSSQTVTNYGFLIVAVGVADQKLDVGKLEWWVS